ncbi:MAG: hypothetical protein O7C75_01995, partial [Verrucomicrobia bacterium]|nr:hypothetical protein [Verrucomicrobiota bacterium]
NAEPREWNHFPATAEGSSLTLSFDLPEPDSYQLLTLRQVSVKPVWEVRLNGTKIGNLDRDHNDLELALPIPSGVLWASGNTLEIFTESQTPNDIRVGEIQLHAQSREVLTGSASVSVRVTDGAKGEPLPCRLTIVDTDRGTLPLLGTKSDDRLAVRSGIIYTLDGQATFGLKPGNYTIWAGRGFEYSVAEKEFTIKKDDRIQISMVLTREVDTTGLVACDTHLHTYEFARHGDCNLIERVITLAGEGIELPISTEHDQHIDYRVEAKRTGADRFYTPVIGCEVTTYEGHFNTFPIESGSKPAVHKQLLWPEVFKNIYATPGVRVAILNHARDVHRGFKPFDPAQFDAEAGVFTDGRELKANGLELINSGAQQSDPMQLVHDWMALLRSGHKIAGVGSSDSHTVNFAIVGQARTYIPCADEEASNLDVDEAVQSFVDGNTSVSFGLLTLVELKDDSVAVKVLGPGWTTADTLTLFANGKAIDELNIPKASGNRPNVKFEKSWDLKKLNLEPGSFLVAIAEGPGVTEPYWPMMPPYQPDTDVFEPFVMGISQALWID